MGTVVQQWGNSLGVRIPKAIAEQVHIAEGTAVSVEASEGTIVIRPAAGRRRYRLSELLARAKGTNPHGEWEKGGPGGKEAI